MAVTFAGHSVGNVAGPDTTFDTGSVTPTANRLQLFAVASARGGSVNAEAPSGLSGCGLTWVKVADVAIDTGGGFRNNLSLWRALGASPSTGAVTITYANSHAECSWSWLEAGNVDITGSNGSGAIVQAVTSTSASVTLAAFSDVDNATYGAFGGNNDGGAAVGSGFSQGHEVDFNDGSVEHWLLSEYKTTNDTIVDCTPAISAQQSGIAIEIKESSGTPPVNVNAAAISGTAEVGSVLSLTDGHGAEDWTGETSIAQKWQRADNVGFTTNVTDIGGATGTTFTLTSSELNKYVRAVVTATNADGSVPSNSNIIGPITANPPVNVTAASISGSAVQGNVLTLGDGHGAEDWTGETSIAQKWQRADNLAFTTNVTDIASATGTTYTLTATEVGKYVRCVVTATNVHGSTPSNSNILGPVTAAPTPPVNVTVPAINGVPQRGDITSLNNGAGPEDWTDETSIAIQWQRADNLAFSVNVADISGATAETFVPGVTEVGKWIRARVRGTNSAGSTDAFSNVLTNAVSDPPAPVNSTAPVASISGGLSAVRLGAVLSCTLGTWLNSPVTYTFQWERADTPSGTWTSIAGATSVWTVESGAVSTYKVTTADLGKYLRCTVTATNANG